MDEHHCDITDCWRKDTTWVPELEMWLCGEHATEDEKPIPPKPTSADVERAATLAWNEAAETAAALARETARRIRKETAAMGGARAEIGEACAKTLEHFDANVLRALKRTT